MTRKKTKDAIIELVKSLQTNQYPDNYLSPLLQFIGLSFTTPQKELTEKQNNHLKKILHDLTQQKPVEYIVNKVDFYKDTFYVNKNVLIPRPDTEALVKKSLGMIGKILNPLTIIDIGTGSGAIIISLYKELARLYPDKSINYIAIDISKEAIEVAKQNASNILGVNNIKWELAKTTPSQKITTNETLIVTNPPYIPQNEMKLLAKSVKDYEPQIALEEQKAFLPTLQQYIDELIENDIRVHLAIEYQKGGKMIQSFANPLEVSLLRLLEQ